MVAGTEMVLVEVVRRGQILDMRIVFIFTVVKYTHHSIYPFNYLIHQYTIEWHYIH